MSPDARAFFDSFDALPAEAQQQVAMEILRKSSDWNVTCVDESDSDRAQREAAERELLPPEQCAIGFRQWTRRNGSRTTTVETCSVTVEERVSESIS
jgi:hypothetical protein